MKDLLIIPGLGDDVSYTKFLVKGWEKKYGIKTHVVAFGWEGSADKFDERFLEMNKKLDELIDKNENVSVLGISAGGSAAINLFSKRKHKIKKVITVCGRLSDINIKPSWKNNNNSYRILKPSIKLCEENTAKLSIQDKKRILTLRPIYDDIVPIRTMTIEGAINKKVNSMQHMISIFLIMTLYSKTIVKFLE